MASETTNLHLKKPAIADAALIEDINDNMDTLDEVISARTQEISRGSDAGLAPGLPSGSGTTKYLREDGSWQEPPGHVYSAASGGGLSLSDGEFSITNSGVSAGSYGPSSNATPGYGSTFNVPQITVDEKGKVTSAATRTVKIPASDNTWRGITNSLNSSDESISLSAYAGKLLNDGKLDKSGFAKFQSSSSSDRSISITLESGVPYMIFLLVPPTRSGGIFTAIGGQDAHSITSDSIHATRSGTTYTFTTGTTVPDSKHYALAVKLI